MTNSTYHSEESRVRSYSVMRLSVRSISLATGVAQPLSTCFVSYLLPLIHELQRSSLLTLSMPI
jgi:hypothetical protein